MIQLQEYIDKHPSQTQRLLGMNYEQLMNLIVPSEGFHAQKPAEIERKKTIIIKPGGGRYRKLTVANEILLTLVNLHQLPIFQIYEYKLRGVKQQPMTSFIRRVGVRRIEESRSPLKIGSIF